MSEKVVAPYGKLFFHDSDITISNRGEGEQTLSTPFLQTKVYFMQVPLYECLFSAKLKIIYVIHASTSQNQTKLYHNLIVQLILIARSIGKKSWWFLNLGYFVW